jgi:hypothetical protein
LFHIGLSDPDCPHRFIFLACETVRLSTPFLRSQNNIAASVTPNMAAISPADID